MDYKDLREHVWAHAYAAAFVADFYGSHDTAESAAKGTTAEAAATVADLAVARLDERWVTGAGGVGAQSR